MRNEKFVIEKMEEALHRLEEIRTFVCGTDGVEFEDDLFEKRRTGMYFPVLRAFTVYSAQDAEEVRLP